MKRSAFQCIKAFYLALGFASTLAGCQKSTYYSLVSGSASRAGAGLASGTGNGIPFDGGIARFIYLDPAHPCGDGMPTAEILLTGYALAPNVELLRSGCANLVPPLALSPSDLQPATDGSGVIIYQGESFTPAPATLASSSSFLAPGASFFAAMVPQGGSQSGNITSPLAPDGTATASRFTEDVANSGHVIYTLFSNYVPGSIMTFVIYVKANGCNLIGEIVQDDRTYSQDIRADFDISQGTVVDTGGSGVLPSAGIVPYPNGWYRLSLSGVPNPSYSDLEFSLGCLDAAVTYGFAGDGTSGFYYWGSQHSP